MLKARIEVLKRVNDAKKGKPTRDEEFYFARAFFYCGLRKAGRGVLRRVSRATAEGEKKKIRNGDFLRKAEGEKNSRERQRKARKKKFHTRREILFRAGVFLYRGLEERVGQLV